MKRWLLFILWLSASAGTALAGTIGPVCREQSVVDVITREVRSQNHYATVDPWLITEEMTSDPRYVRCGVCVLSAPYDMARFGDRPIRQCMAQTFQVRILSNGFLVGRLR